MLNKIIPRLLILNSFCIYFYILSTQKKNIDKIQFRVFTVIKYCMKIHKNHFIPKLYVKICKH